MAKIPKYAAFILTYGRADNEITTDILRKHGYTGDIFYIVDDSDSDLEKYQERFGSEKVIVFSKEEVKGSFDIMDNLSNDDVVVFARNKSFSIAKDLGLDYFVMLDDDYSEFRYRFDEEYGYIGMKPIKKLDRIFESLITYLANTPIKTICFSQGGDFIGGKDGYFGESVRARRKCMNAYVFKTDRPIQFLGRLNEDTNTYVRLGMTGDIVLTTSQVSIQQLETQSNKGGLTDAYLETGTYTKSFYSVMINPSAVKVSRTGNTHYRIHHAVRWNHAAPKILRESEKKVTA